MIRLNMPNEPYWIKLDDGVRVKVRPCDTRIYSSAQAAARVVVAEAMAAMETVEKAGGRISGLDLNSRADLEGLSQYTYVRTLARLAIVAWEGIVDDDGDKPLPVTPESVDRLMAFHDLADRFMAEFAAPYTDRVIEGNGSGPLSDGDTEQGPNIAQDAANVAQPAQTAA